MKRVILFLAVMMLGVVSASAQKSPYNYYKPGYWGNVEFLGGVAMGGGSDIGGSTTHGYCFGSGVAMGMGVGVYCDVNQVAYYINVPIFVETKYSPLRGGSSPFVSLRTGMSVTDWLQPGFYLSPALGFDIKRFSLFARYGFNLYPVMVDINVPDLDINLSTNASLRSHTLSVGFAVNF